MREEAVPINKLTMVARWDGGYKYGTMYGGASDMIVAPIASVLSNTTDTGLTILLSPRDPFLELMLATTGAYGCVMVVRSCVGGRYVPLSA